MKITRGVRVGNWVGVRVSCGPVSWTTFVPVERWGNCTEAECEVQARGYMERRGFREAAFVGGV